MRSRFPRRGIRSGGPENHYEQPGFPMEEARLLDVRQEGGSVFLALEDGVTLEVAPEAVPETLPNPGEMIPLELLADLRLAAERKLVARWIFTVLDRRLQPVARIRDKAAEKGYSRAAVDGVLEQMAARGLYSDRNFAEAYCRDCLAGRAVGRRYLVSKLREKKVPALIATQVAEEILDPETEEDLAARAATIRWRRIKDTGDRKNLAKVVRFLQGRGFDAGTANRAARKTQPRTEDVGG
jgi:SOS response regulatory protein OraA/RecX